MQNSQMQGENRQNLLTYTLKNDPNLPLDICAFHSTFPCICIFNTILHHRELHAPHAVLHTLTTSVVLQMLEKFCRKTRSNRATREHTEEICKRTQPHKVNMHVCQLQWAWIMFMHEGFTPRHWEREPGVNVWTQTSARKADHSCAAAIAAADQRESQNNLKHFHLTPTKCICNPAYTSTEYRLHLRVRKRRSPATLPLPWFITGNAH